MHKSNTANTVGIFASLSISNFGQNITFKDKNEQKSYLKSRSKDDDDIINSVLEYLRKKAK